jgi:hypothetical protein
LTKKDAAKIRRQIEMMKRPPRPKLPAEEISRIRSLVGQLGGRPQLKQRCPCGANSLKRAFARGYECCKKAGLIPRQPQQPVDKT